MQVVHMDGRAQFAKRENQGLERIMLLFSVAPDRYRKILFVLKHLRKNVSLAAHYVKTQGHLIGPGVEIWEFDLDAKQAQRIF